MPWKQRPLEIYQRENVDYYLFVDESGEHIIENFDTSKPYFTVAGVLIKKDDYNTIKENINQLKNKYWQEGTFKEKNKYLKKVCFVNRQIRRKQNAFSHHYLDEQKYHAFLEDITTFMAEQEYKIIASSIDKQRLVTKYSNPTEPYQLAMEFIVERFARFLKTNNATGLIMLESRGTREDGNLLKRFLEFFDNGTRYFSSNYVQKTITGGFYFNGKWNKEKNNLDTFCGLEMADLVAHPIGHFVQTGQKSRPFTAFESKFLGFENYMGKGLKVFP